MARFTIFTKNLTADQVSKMQALAKASGDDDTMVEVTSNITLPDLNAENDIILVLGTPGVCAALDLEDDFIKAANGPRRAIWIWPEGAEDAAVPPSAEKYCYSYIPWDANKLRAVAADDDVTYFETATGTAVPKVRTERNLCIEAAPKEEKPQ